MSKASRFSNEYPLTNDKYCIQYIKHKYTTCLHAKCKHWNIIIQRYVDKRVTSSYINIYMKISNNTSMVSFIRFKFPIRLNEHWMQSVAICSLISLPNFAIERYLDGIFGNCYTKRKYKFVIILFLLAFCSRLDLFWVQFSYIFNIL